MLTRFIIGLVLGALEAVILVPAFWLACGQSAMGSIPLLLAAVALFAGVGSALSAETSRRAIGLTLLAGGVAGAAISVIGHANSLNLLMPELTMDQRLLARMNGTMALLFAFVALPVAGWCLKQPGSHKATVKGREWFDETHRHLAGFNRYYQNEIDAWLFRQEQQKLVANRSRRLLISLGLPLVAGASLALVAYFHPGYPPLFLIAPLALGALVILSVLFEPRPANRASVKSEIMRRLCRFFELQYNDKGNGLEMIPFRHLLLVPAYHRVRVEDVMWGRPHGRELYLAEAMLQVRTGNSLPLMPAYKTTFQGLLVTLGLPRPIDGDIILLSRKHYARRQKEAATTGLQVVPTDDPELERHFRVLAADPAEVASVLTPAVRAHFARIAEAVGHQRLQVAIHGDRMFFAIAKRKAWFKATAVSQALGSPHQVRRFVADIETVFDLADLANDLAETPELDSSSVQTAG